MDLVNGTERHLRIIIWTLPIARNSIIVSHGPRVCNGATGFCECGQHRAATCTPAFGALVQFALQAVEKIALVRH